MIALSFTESSQLLQQYHFPWVKTGVFTSSRKANQFVKKIGFPVVLKVNDPQILHRTEKKGVMAGITNQPDFVIAWKKLAPFLQKSKEAGIIVQKMESGIELAAGMKRDSQFGSIIMFGLGGIFIEIFQDVSFRLAPFSKKVAREMIQEIKAYPLLTGFRKRKPVDLDQLESILVDISRLSLDHPEIQEIDFNPIIASGRRIKIVDAKFLINEKS